MAAKEIRNCCSVLFLLVIVGVNGTWNISIEEDMELERQLKILNKPAINSIRTDYGDIFDCVDINKQHSLDHPLLKGHKVQMRPRTFPKATRDQSLNVDESSSILESSAIGLTKRCPSGTVPIRRARKEDLIGNKAFSKIYAEKHATKFHKHFQGAAGYHAAAQNTKLTEDSKFFGAQAYFSIYNPEVLVGQASTAMVFLNSGLNYNELNSIQAGWAVQPSLFGDNRTRLYTSWTKDGFHTTGCANLYCYGFIQVNPDIPLGMSFPNISNANISGRCCDMKVTVFKDAGVGNWWLLFSENNTVMGYWPKDLFNSLASHAQWIEWGGEVYSQPPYTVTPPMGSGILFETIETTENLCYGKQLQLQTVLGGNLIDVDPSWIESHADAPNCYNVGGNFTRRDPQYGYMFYFGGPGGQCRT